MRDIDRAILLETLGWPQPSNLEGVAHWSKASSDMLSSLSYRIQNSPEGVRATIDLEECDEEFNAVNRPLLSVEFALNARGRLQLARHVQNGREHPLGEQSQPDALEACAKAKSSFQGRPKLAMLASFGPAPERQPGAKL